MLRGIDVSDWQPDIDWSAVAGAGYSFAIVKATQGTGNVQYVLDPYREQAPVAGIGPFGMYHFAQDGDATAQADHFCDVVGELAPDEFAVLDIEANTTFFTLPQSQWPAFIVAWCDRVESRLGGPVVVYMSESPASSMPDSVGRWPLWVAGYVSYNPTRWDDWRVGPWSPSIWQHTSTAHVPGVGGNCDANIAPDDLRARLGIVAAPTPVPTPAPVPKEDDMASPYTLFNWGGAVWAWSGGDPLPLDNWAQVEPYLNQGAVTIGNLTDEQFSSIAPTWKGRHPAADKDQSRAIAAVQPAA